MKRSFTHATHDAEIDIIYEVAVKKKECSYGNFYRQIKRVLQLARCYPPEYIILIYYDNHKPIKISLKDATRNNYMLIKSVIAVGGCICDGKDNPDQPEIMELLSLDSKPSEILKKRGNIISEDFPKKIQCLRISDLMNELLK